jgi:ABC-type multidrug transport system fused ATPase/permease subunit
MNANVAAMLPVDMPQAQADSPAPRGLLRLDNVSKTFANATVALQNVDLVIRPGEFLSLLGPPAAASRRCSS